ncbi:hypothetical protein Btru_065190 [Bulinus truncatus]|nr:hypothetical protein Btru_065190 [Bulinus truncatus]
MIGFKPMRATTSLRRHIKATAYTEPHHQGAHENSPEPMEAKIASCACFDLLDVCGWNQRHLFFFYGWSVKGFVGCRGFKFPVSTVSGHTSRSPCVIPSLTCGHVMFPPVSRLNLMVHT